MPGVVGLSFLSSLPADFSKSHTEIHHSSPPLFCRMFNLTPVQTHDTAWSPGDATVALNLTLDACIVPTSCDPACPARVDCAHLVVLDDFIGESERQELLDFITEPGEPGGTWPCSFAPNGPEADSRCDVNTRCMHACMPIRSRLCSLCCNAMHTSIIALQR